MTTTLYDESYRKGGQAGIGPRDLVRIAGPDSVARACEATLHIETWLDPVVDQIGHDPRSSYVETYWLPVLGPSTTWLLRRFASYLDEMPAGIALDTEELARGLGLGERYGPNAPFARTIKRCVDFQMAEWRHSSLAVRRHVPPLARRHLRRLPEALQVRHAAEVEAALRSNVTDRLRLHGRRLALSLLDYGEDRAAVEQQLMRWAFHPALAAECATWAVLEHARRQASRAVHPACGDAAPPAGTTRGQAGQASAAPSQAAPSQAAPSQAAQAHGTQPKAAQAQPQVQIRA
jgi:hypothetical protein